MANVCRFFSFVVFFTIIAKGYSQCSIKKISIEQSKTGQVVQGKPEWKVTVVNPCPCTVLNVKLSCPGFQSVEAVESSVMSKSGDECLLNNGQPIYARSNFSFNYAWDNSFSLTPLYCNVACS